MSPPRALILSGEGRYGDPWHPFAETSAVLLGILGARGVDGEVRGDVDEALATSHVDLLVVNLGEGTPDGARMPSRAAGDGIGRHLQRGGSILALHAAASAFASFGEWEDAIGARWVAGSMHPPLGAARIRVGGRHPVVRDVADFTVTDERYCGLRLAPDVVPLASHEHAEASHPLLWVRQFRGSRIVYDALGHDRRSFETAAHAQVIANAVDWLVDDRSRQIA